MHHSGACQVLTTSESPDISVGTRLQRMHSMYGDAQRAGSEQPGGAGCCLRIHRVRDTLPADGLRLLHCHCQAPARNGSADGPDNSP